MATYPPRYDMAFRTMQTTGREVDEFYLYVNDVGAAPPGWLQRTPRNAHVYLASRERGNLGDVGKFYPLQQLPSSAFVLLMDDDLDYPDNYVGRMIQSSSRYDHEHVVGVHGCDLPNGEVSSYYGQGQINKRHFSQPLHEDRPVHLLGTGTVAFRASTAPVGLEAFPLQNMADLFFAEWCQHSGVGMVMVRRPAAWIGEYPTPDGGIYESYRNDDAAQTHIVNRNSWTHYADL